MTPEKETDINHLTYETGSFSNSGLISELDKFIQSEIDILKSFEDAEESVKNDQELFDYHQQLVWNASSIKITIDNNCDPNLSFMTLAKDGDRVVGLNLVGINEEQSDDEKNINLSIFTCFVGVSPDYSRRGLGLKLVNQRHKKFREMGVRSYKTRVWPGSRKLMEKSEHKSITDIDDSQIEVVL